MKRVFLFAAALTAVTAFAQPKAGPVDMAADLQQSFNGGKNKILQAAEEMPDAGYGYQPTPEVRTFAGWVGHLVDTNAQFCNVVTGGNKSFNAEKGMTSKTELVAALKESFAICDAAYSGTTMANHDDIVQTPFRGPRPRAAWLYFNIAHNEEGYGSMAVYLRMQKLVPPSSQGRGGAKGKAK